MSSPFALALAPFREDLPDVFHAQFLGPDPGRVVVLSGTMREVWHRPRWIAPVLSLLARSNMLFPETGRDIPASLTIEALPDGRHSWRRTFSFRRVRRFDALIASDLERGVVEQIGARVRFEIGWRLRHDADRLEIETTQAALCLGGRRASLPRALTPRVRVVEEAHPRLAGAIRVELVASHPLLGAFFGYSGTFRLETRPL